MLGSKLFQLLSSFLTHWIPQDLGTSNILKYLSYVSKDKKVYVSEVGEKVEALVFKIFWLRLQNRAISYLHLAIAFKCSQKSSAPEQAAGGVTLNACQSIWLKHITILSHNISPLMTNCSSTICDYNRAIPVEGQKLWLAFCLLSGTWPWDSYTPMGGLWEGRGEPTYPCPQVYLEAILLSCFCGAKARRKSHPEQDGSSFKLPLHLCTRVVLVLPLEMQTPYSEIDCYDLMVCP